MKLSNKIQTWTENGLITRQQAEKIMLFEQATHSNSVWKWMYAIAGLFIGLGMILIIGANWDAIPAVVKLIADFTVFAGMLYLTYRAVIDQRRRVAELFLIMSFLFTGATIGLIAQVFNLSGGWQSFAMAWSLLGMPFVLFSRLFMFNFWWLCLLLTSFDFYWVDDILRYVHRHIDGLILFILVLSLFGYAGGKLDKKINQYTLLPRAFSILSMLMIYVSIFVGSFSGKSWRFFDLFQVGSIAVYSVAFLFFGSRMFWAFKTQNMLSFKRNAIVVEIYIFLIFCSRFGNLLLSGFGFITAGVATLVFVYLIRKTSKYIKKMEVFHE